jgi:PAS domain S-box-containing protein
LNPTPFWRDVWLIIISFLMFMGTLYIYFRLRSSNFRRVRRTLEERVEVKTKQLVEKNLELEKLSLVASRTDNAVLIADTNGTIEWVNDGFIRLFAIPKEKVIGNKLSDINVYSNISNQLNEVIQHRHSRIFESNVNTFNKKNVWISSTLTPIYDESGTLKKFILVDADITTSRQMQQQIEASLKEKDVLLKEIHHRVKNNLQIIISLLNLQSGYIKDETTLKAVKDGQSRVRSMALVHEKFYQSDTVTEIDFGEYLKKLCQFLYQTYGDKTDRIEVVIKGEQILLDMDTAMPCALLVNEIVSNAYKYAFPGLKSGTILIEMKKAGGKIDLAISDNGVGFPAEYNFEKSESLGMQLVQALSSQIEGDLKVSQENGSSFEVIFPYPKKAS